METFLAQHDITVGGGRILMAAQARAFGFCFNPITVFWCRNRAGALVATLVEVHNTYGDRHVYLVHADEHGRTTTPKEMYVSPFHGTDGWYEIQAPEPNDRLSVVVTLHTGEGPRFTATLTGRRVDTGPWRAAPAALRGWLLIHLHGIRLWMKKLPVRPRPRHRQEGVQ